MKPEQQLSIAIKLASDKHSHMFDKGGNPYILHCIWVMQKVRHLGIEYMIVAVLHDILEDTDITAEDLIQMGISPILVQVIQMLTKDDEVDYQEYIENISINKIARRVKMRDLEHNSKITRLKGLRPKDFIRLEKYQRAYVYLRDLDRI